VLTQVETLEINEVM